MMARRSSPLGLDASRIVDLGEQKEGDIDSGIWWTAALSIRPTRLISWVCGRLSPGLCVAVEAKVLEGLLMVGFRDFWERGFCGLACFMMRNDDRKGCFVALFSCSW